MKVQAKCIIRSWDSVSCIMFTPNEVYEIDRESSLAGLKTPMGGYVFDFDRNGSRTDEGVEVKKDYTCKKCGAPFKTLAQLGVHSNQLHRDVHEAQALKEEIDENAPLRVENRGRKKNRTFNCRICGELIPNLYQIRVHNKEKHPAVEATPVEL